MKDDLGGKIMIEFVALQPKTYSYLTLFRMKGGQKGPPYQFFPCNFYKRRIWSPKRSDF